MRARNCKFRLTYGFVMLKNGRYTRIQKMQIFDQFFCLAES